MSSPSTRKNPRAKRSVVKVIATILLLAAGSASAGCGGGGGGTGGGGGAGTAVAHNALNAVEWQFAITDASIAQGDVWQINRPIEITFSGPVNPQTVNGFTVRVNELGGAPVPGTLYVDPACPSKVIFQPRCPTLPDLSDAGLLLSNQGQGTVRQYEVEVLGTVGGSSGTVRSLGGHYLTHGLYLTFSTPDVSDPVSTIFLDPKPGPPAPVIRGMAGVGEASLNATYVEVGGNADPASRLYFKNGVLEGGAVLPLNLYSMRESQVSLILMIDQPVSPAEANTSSEAVRWEFKNEGGQFEALRAHTRLVENCTATGATLRMEPEGLLPPDAELRVVITSNFTDIVGEANAGDLTDFAYADSAKAPVPPGHLEDELLEPFLVGGDEEGSLHDYLASLSVPPASWADDGALRAAFEFGGTGGPGGNFDWQVADGETFTFDTTSQTITGGPNFVPTTQLTAVGGVLDVRNFRVGVGSKLKFSGPNDVTIMASGWAEVQGIITVEGNDSMGVATLNTTNIPEPGAPGQAGGGKGGIGSPLTTASSPSGGSGHGAFNAPDGGGRGGETGWNPDSTSVSHRRGAGGGGGRFGHDQLAYYPPWFVWAVDESWIGLNVEKGFDGGQQAFGAKDPAAFTSPPQGGDPGLSPFLDANPDNDFWGTMEDPGTQSLIVGELDAPHPGAGGGGGGDSSYTAGQMFPAVPFDPTGDEKGAGGGGGGGAITMLVLGNITFGPDGQVSARGGTGGGGENTAGLDRVGAGSGGGSGGHLILQTTSVIDMSQSLAGTVGHPPALFATGGQGGVGANNQGGATIGGQGSKETKPELDACPDPLLGCLGHVTGAGGDGGPGIVQLHTPTGAAGVLLPAGTALPDVCKPAPLDALIPIMSSKSAARSVWIPLGQGGRDVNDPLEPWNLVRFLFNGTDPSTGLVTAVGGMVPPLGAVHPVSPLAPPPSLPHIDPADPFMLVVDAALVQQGVPQQPLDLKVSPSMLKSFVIELRDQASPADYRRWEILDVTFEDDKIPGVETFTLAVDPGWGPLSSFTPPGGVEVLVYPTFFRVSTDGQLDELPDSAIIKVTIEVTIADANGDPDPNGVRSATDVSVINADPGNRDFRFFRFVVFFDIDAQGQGLEPDQPLPALEFFRLPFQFIDTSPSPGRGLGTGRAGSYKRDLSGLTVPRRF